MKVSVCQVTPVDTGIFVDGILVNRCKNENKSEKLAPGIG